MPVVLVHGTHLENHWSRGTSSRQVLKAQPRMAAVGQGRQKREWGFSLSHQQRD